MKIDLTTDPAEEDVLALSQWLTDFNAKTVNNLEKLDEKIKFFVIAKNDDGMVIGGLRGLCYWNTLHIELLWINEEYKGQRLGSKIIFEAEKFAISKGYENAFVDTTSWQARPFYERHGYELVATINNRPKGHKSFYLLKILVNDLKR